MAKLDGHLSDTELSDLAEPQFRPGGRANSHLAACAACRARRADLVRLQVLLAQTGDGERRPPRDIVPAAMKRLRLRRYSIANTNEVLAGFAALMRGLASLFSLPVGGERGLRSPGAQDERHG